MVSFGSYFFAKLSFLLAAVVEPTCAVVDMGSCGLGGDSFVATMLRFFDIVANTMTMTLRLSLAVTSAFPG